MKGASVCTDQGCANALCTGAQNDMWVFSNFLFFVWTVHAFSCRVQAGVQVVSTRIYLYYVNSGLLLLFISSKPWVGQRQLDIVEKTRRNALTSALKATLVWFASARTPLSNILSVHKVMCFGNLPVCRWAAGKLSECEKQISAL